MTKAIFYKEWIKLRFLIFALATLFVGSIPYFILNLTNKFRFAGKAHLWSVIVSKDMNLISELTYVPLMAGLLLGFAQCAPEMHKKSLKLTLHLPHPEKLTIFKMLLFGSGTLGLLFGFTAIALFFSLNFYLPLQILSAWVSLVLPWYMAGILAYFLSVWVCLEPSWKQRTINILLAIPLLMFYYKSGASYSFMYSIPVGIGLLVISSFFPYYSVFRFKEGVQG